MQQHQEILYPGKSGSLFIRSVYVNLSAPTVYNTSSNAFVNHPLPCCSFANSVDPQAANSTCDLSPAYSQPSATAVARAMGSPSQMSASRFDGRGCLRSSSSMLRTRRVASVSFVLVPEAAWHRSNMTVYCPRKGPMNDVIAL